MPMLNPEFLEKLRVSKGEEGANSGLLKLPCPHHARGASQSAGGKTTGQNLGFG